MTIKFINLNLFHGGIDIYKIIKFFKKEKADILTLQEVYNGKDKNLAPRFRTIEVIKKAFPNFNAYFSEEMLLQRSEGKIELGNAILSRFPIVFKKTVFFDVPYQKKILLDPNNDFSQFPRNLQIVQIKTSQTTINVVNLHGIWGRDGNDNPRREQMSKKIVKQIKNKKNVILAGDFNCDPNIKAIERIEKYLVSVFKDELKTSFNLEIKKKYGFQGLAGYAKAVVDMVFVSKNIKILKKKCPYLDLSDHLPLICIFEV